jgi:uncharacterized protein YcaQ
MAVVITDERQALALARDEARWLAVIAQRLDRRPFRRRPTAADILDTFEHLGTIQLDTISVISRSHETVLWSRLGPYDPDLVTELYDPRNALTEYLAHAASILPTSMLPLFRSHMEKARNHEGWASQPENHRVMDHVLERIRTHGPVASRHFDAPEDAERAGIWEWWGNKPERRALSALWIRGEVMIHQRDRGFARYFDLPERVAPGFWEAEPLEPDTVRRDIIRHALRALGVTTARWATDYFRTGGQAHVTSVMTKKTLQELEQAGEAIPIEIPGIDEPAWLDPSLREQLELLRERKGRPTLTTLLSPFDNLIWNRPRGEQLWDFFYRLECYTPAPKRQYGYYSLPILHRGRIVGRLDPSYNRKARVLTVKALHLEPWVRPSEALMRSIAGAIEDLLRFLGGEPGAWVVQRTEPASLLPMLLPHAGAVSTHEPNGA